MSIDTDTRKVRAKIASDHYRNTKPYGPGLEKLTKEQTRIRREEWRTEEQRLVDLLHADLAAEHEVTDNPKEAMLWNKAWDHGHANGYNEVVICYEDFVELIK